MDIDTICTSQCEYCLHGQLVEEKGKAMYIYCSEKEKQFVFGSYINCDSFSKDKDAYAEVIKEKEERLKKLTKPKKKRRKKND